MRVIAVMTGIVANSTHAVADDRGPALVFTGHATDFTELACSPDGRQLVAGGGDVLCSGDIRVGGTR